MDARRKQSKESKKTGTREILNQRVLVLRVRIPTARQRKVEKETPRIHWRLVSFTGISHSARNCPRWFLKGASADSASERLKAESKGHTLVCFCI